MLVSSLPPVHQISVTLQCSFIISENSLLLFYYILFLVHNMILLSPQNPKSGQSLPFILIICVHFHIFRERGWAVGRILMNRGRQSRKENLFVFILYWEYEPQILNLCIIPLHGKYISTLKMQWIQLLPVAPKSLDSSLLLFVA